MMTGTLPDIRGSRAVTTLLRVFVTLRLFGPSSLPLANSSTQSGSEMRIKACLAAVIPAIIASSVNICNAIDPEDNEAEVMYLCKPLRDFADMTQQPLLTMVARLLSYAKYLYDVGQESRLDHSAVHVVVQWLTECSREQVANILDIETSVNALANAVALTSGLGLSEIWSSLSKSPGEDAQTSKLAVLDDVAQKLPGTRQGQSILQNDICMR